MFSLVKRSVSLVLAALLIFLFTVPAGYLNQLVGALDADCRNALLSIEVGDDPKPYLIAVRDRFDKSANKLRLFLDHTVVDTVAASIHAIVPLEDGADQKSAIEALRTELIQMADIERLDLYTLF